MPLSIPVSSIIQILDILKEAFLGGLSKQALALGVSTASCSRNRVFHWSLALVLSEDRVYRTNESENFKKAQGYRIQAFNRPFLYECPQAHTLYLNFELHLQRGRERTQSVAALHSKSQALDVFKIPTLPISNVKARVAFFR